MSAFKTILDSGNLAQRSNGKNVERCLNCTWGNGEWTYVRSSMCRRLSVLDSVRTLHEQVSQLTFVGDSVTQQLQLGTLWAGQSMSDWGKSSLKHYAWFC